MKRVPLILVRAFHNTLMNNGTAFQKIRQNNIFIASTFDRSCYFSSVLTKFTADWVPYQDPVPLFCCCFACSLLDLWRWQKVNWHIDYNFRDIRKTT